MSLSAGTVSLPVKPEMGGFGAALSQGMAQHKTTALAEGAKIGKWLGVGLLAAGVLAVKMGSDFQESTTRLVTGAGESEKSLEMVRQGLLKMAPAVGMGPDALAKGMFLVESAGFHAAAGLTVMKAAAEGAKIGGADATVVANALTTVLTDFHKPASEAAKVTSELVATVAAGKTNMAELAGALASVAPQASSAGISLNEMLGAMGTMTGEGISAQQSAQDLAASIASLSNPTSVQTKSMAQMGLNSIDVAKNLGKNGLTGTFDTLAQAVMQHMGPAGLVLQSSFNESKVAAASAQEMLKKLPPSLQGLGKEFLNNQITQKQWAAALKGQDVLTANLGKEFATTAKTANGFSSSLRSGSGSASTFNGMMADMTGGSTGLATSLALTGTHMGTFKDNVNTIGSASTEAGGHVKGWAETQKDFATQMAQATAGLQVMAVKIGTALIPVIANAVKIGGQWADFLGKNKPLLYGIVGALGVVVTTFIGMSIAKGIIDGVRIAMTLWTGAQWLLNVAMDANPIGLIILGIAALVAGIVWVATQTHFFQDAWKVMTDVIGTAWNWLWTVVIKPVVDFIVGAFQGIAAVFSWMWDNILYPIFQIFEIYVRILGVGIGWLADNVIGPALTGIGAAFGWLWDTIMKPMVDLMVGQMQAFGAVVDWLWKNAIEPRVHQMGDVFNWLWTNAIKPVVDFISGGISAIADVTAKVLGAVGKTIKGEFTGINNFIIDVFNNIVDIINGVIGTIKNVGGAVGVNLKIGALPHIPHLAEGGIVPATPGGRLVRVAEGGKDEIVGPLDKVRAALSGGGKHSAAPTFNIYEAVSARATAMQVNRIQASLGA